MKGFRIPKTKIVCTRRSVIKQLYTHSPTNNPAQWVPCPVIKPIQKIVKPIINHIMSRTVIKPEINKFRNVVKQMTVWSQKVKRKKRGGDKNRCSETLKNGNGNISKK